MLRLFEEVRGDGQARTAEVTLASAEGDSAEASTVSLRIAPHPARDRIFLVTARNVTAHGERLQHLCRALDALRAERDEWESAARSVAHDVRSSLAALTGFLSLSLLEPSALGPGAREHVSRALEIGTRLTTLTELLIDNPRRRPAEAEFLDLGAFGTRLLIALQVAHSQVGFAWSVEASGVGLRTSPSALWNLLWGLVTNSVKYRHPGRQLHIDLRARMHGGEVEIELQDNGIGIPPGEEEAVFAPGCRGSNAGAQEGSGLGLHGVRLLTQKCRGRVLAEPSPAGATFRVFLPASGPAG
ncbi:MAG: sensor histidine kinase [Deferrisomatales bacterium]|nr:sensor histidine kinase [Deferrisomatales bacterium]